MSSLTFIADAALQRDWRKKRDAKFEGLDSRFRMLQPSACLAYSAIITSPTSLTYFAGCSKWPSSKAAGESKPEAYPLGYVEDFDSPKTPLADFSASC